MCRCADGFSPFDCLKDDTRDTEFRNSRVRVGDTACRAGKADGLEIYGFCQDSRRYRCKQPVNENSTVSDRASATTVTATSGHSSAHGESCRSTICFMSTKGIS